MVTTRSAAVAKMEEQLAWLLVKMEEMSQQLQLLTRQHSQRVDEVAKKQEETHEQMQATAGDLNWSNLLCTGDWEGWRMLSPV